MAKKKAAKTKSTKQEGFYLPHLNLTGQMASQIQRLMDEGYYGSKSELARAALRDLIKKWKDEGVLD